MKYAIVQLLVLLIIVNTSFSHSPFIGSAFEPSLEYSGFNSKSNSFIFGLSLLSMETYHLEESSVLSLRFGTRWNDNNESGTRWKFTLFEMFDIKSKIDGNFTDKFRPAFGITLLDYDKSTEKDLFADWLSIKVGVGYLKSRNSGFSFGPLLYGEISLNSTKLGSFNYSGLGTKSNDTEFGAKLSGNFMLCLINKKLLNLDISTGYSNLYTKDKIGEFYLSSELILPISEYFSKEEYQTKFFSLSIKYKYNQVSFDNNFNANHYLMIGVSCSSFKF